MSERTAFITYWDDGQDLYWHGTVPEAIGYLGEFLRDDLITKIDIELIDSKKEAEHE
jgi:hypothetical protein